MKNEVQFQPDERALLDWLAANVKTDNALAVSDTRLIEALGWDEKRFFVAKGHLLSAGAIGMYRDGNGRQLLRLLMPERPDKASKRYVFMVVPLDMAERVRGMVMAERKKSAVSNLPLLRKPGGLPPSLPGKPAEPSHPQRHDYREAQKKGMETLGVSPVKRPGPSFRPPIRRQGR